MHILAIADRAPQQSLKDIIASQPIDVIVTLGDLGFFELKELQNINHIPKIGVYGNHCSGGYFQDLGIMNMHMMTWEFQGVTFGGFQGCVRYKSNPEAIMWTQEEASALLAGFPYVDVMLVHCPPHGINDDPSEISHTGFVGLRTYIEKHHPKYLLHGHTYPKDSERVTEHAGTKIEYVYGEKVLNLSL